MIYLLSALIFSLSIVITFKLIPRYGISVTQAITVNYLVATILGIVSLKQSPDVKFFLYNSWNYVAVFSGIFLILVFNIFALSTEKAGVAITAVSSKMSVIIPVILGALLFNEKLQILKIVGVILVMFSFYLVFKKKEGYKIKMGAFILPFLLFLGNGTNDSILKYAQYNHINTNEGYVKYLTISFSVSFVLGLFVLLIKMLIKYNPIKLKNIFVGIWLGTINWFSTLFFLKGLGSMDVSVFVPIFNAGLVSSAALVGIFIFKEKMNRLNILGIILSIIAISIIAYSNG